MKHLALCTVCKCPLGREGGCPNCDMPYKGDDTERMCGHPERHEWRGPSVHMAKNRLMRTRFWQCPSCGGRWTTMKKAFVSNSD
jgi:hypothetical protein